MKFVTYAEQNNSNPRFGFKVEKQIVDVTRAVAWANENLGNDVFLSIPGSLKEALADWDKNFSLLKKLENIRNSPNSLFDFHSAIGGKDSWNIIN